MVEYGIVGLAIAAVLIVGLQVRPQNLLPSTGVLQISIQSDPFVVTCHGHGRGNVTLTDLMVNISSVEVHRSGVLNTTGDWIPLANVPKTVDILQLNSITQLGSTSVDEGTINIVRIDLTGANANNGQAQLVVSSDHLQAEPNAQVTGGMTTTITVVPHVVCQGNSTFRLTPELTASSTAS